MMLIDLIAKILAPPHLEEIDSMEIKERLMFTALRKVYGSLMMNGPFSIIVAHYGEMIGLTDRKKLRDRRNFRSHLMDGQRIFVYGNA